MDYNERLTYLDAISEITKTPIKILLKKEAKEWIDDMLFDLSIVQNFSEIEITFGNTVRDKYRRVTLYFRYHLKYSHCYFNNALPPEDNIEYVLRKNFGLSDIEIDSMLRMKIKAFLKRHHIEPARKIKFFYSQNL